MRFLFSPEWVTDVEPEYGINKQWRLHEPWSHDDGKIFCKANCVGLPGLFDEHDCGPSDIMLDAKATRLNELIKNVQKKNADAEAQKAKAPEVGPAEVVQLGTKQTEERQKKDEGFAAE